MIMMRAVGMLPYKSGASSDLGNRRIGERVEEVVAGEDGWS